MNEEHGLEDRVSLTPGATRCISSNEAGRYLVKGMRIRIATVENDHLVIHPYDVTGQHLDYGLKVLERVEKTVEISFNGTKYTLLRKQYPVTVGCAVTASSFAGLTFKEPVLLDNSRSSIAANFYIFSGRNKDPKQIFLRHRLIKAKKPFGSGLNSLDNFGGAQGLYFDIKVYYNALLFNTQLEKLYNEKKDEENPIIALKAPVVSLCSLCKLYECKCVNVRHNVTPH